MFISYSFLFDDFLFVQSVGASCAPEPTLRGARRRQLRLIIHLSQLFVYMHLSSQKISSPAPWDGTAGRTAARSVQHSHLLASKAPGQPTPFSSLWK